MSLEQNVSPSPTTPQPQPAASAIENEFPTYRAISPHAVIAVIAGALSIFSALHGAFLLCALGAVVLGVYAERKIQRYSDILTGRSLAQAGIAMGLIFGLGTVTIQFVQYQLQKSQAAAFGKEVAKVLKEGDLDQVVWLKQHPASRRGKSPADVKAELVKAMRDQQMFEMEFAGFKAIKARVGSAGGDVHFDRVEEVGNSDLDSYAAILLEVHGAETKEHPNKEEFALLFVKSAQDEKSGKTEWWIEQVKYPYTPNTFVAPAKAVDDGHGHAH